MKVPMCRRYSLYVLVTVTGRLLAKAFGAHACVASHGFNV